MSRKRLSIVSLGTLIFLSLGVFSAKYFLEKNPFSDPPISKEKESSVKETGQREKAIPENAGTGFDTEKRGKIVEGNLRRHSDEPGTKAASTNGNKPGKSTAGVIESPTKTNNSTAQLEGGNLEDVIKGRGRNNFLKLALRFRSDLFDLKIQNHRNSLTYFEDFVFEDRSKMA